MVLNFGGAQAKTINCFSNAFELRVEVNESSVATSSYDGESKAIYKVQEFALDDDNIGAVLFDYGSLVLSKSEDGLCSGELQIGGEKTVYGLICE